jgi:membrane protease YdiL (CAAX protease family)
VPEEPGHKHECTIVTVLPENSEPLPELVGAPPELMTRRRALLEVILCSGYPTQLVIAVVLISSGIGAGADGNPSPAFIFGISALDTLLLLTLVFLFLRQSGESARELFIGSRPPAGEIVFGALTVPGLIALVIGMQLLLRAIAPSLHNVLTSPFEAFMTSPASIVAFLAVLIIAGGVREELQRAFLLRRFEQHLGGARVGLAVTSIAFGLGHTLQGWDAAVGTATLGAIWAAIYLSRRTVVCTVTSHALFNVLQVVLGYLVKGSL